MTRNCTRSLPSALIVPVFALIIALIPSAASAQRPASGINPSDPSFLPAVPYGSGGTYAWSVAVADVNGDGNLDLLVADCGSGFACGDDDGTVGVLLGNGDGTFQPVVDYYAGGRQTYSIAVADLNGDGKLDVVVSNSSVSNTIGVLLGNGDGTFQRVVTYNSGGGSPWTLAIADVNRDGKPDILVANSSSCSECTDQGLVGVLLGNGDGTFRPAVTYSSGGYNYFNPASLAVADLNGDGILDVAVTNGCGASSSCAGKASVAVLQGNGDGTFRPALIHPSGGWDASSVVIADVNGDGKPDLLVANAECTITNGCTPSTVGVLLGNGNGTFLRAQLYRTGGLVAHDLTVADLNGDGILDIAVANECAYASQCGVGITGSVSLLVGNGDGTFRLASRYRSGGYWVADHVAVADVNGDGLPDLLVVNLEGESHLPYEGSVGVLLNNTQPLR
jgi:hypothetical protein